jgi:L-fuconolactonase
MPKEHPVLTRVYSADDLAPELSAAEIAHTILVQAAASVEETDYMLSIAQAHDSVAAVVGWIDFENRDDLKQLQRLKKHPKFVGVRPMIQDIADVDWMLRGDVQWAFEALIDLDLTFDALGFSRHLANFHKILTRYPRLRCVIDHCMKPQIRDHGTGQEEFALWAAGMARLASDTGAYCKLSGVVTEAKAGWTIEDLRPYTNHVLAAFLPSRVMWGSDWPVCLLTASYKDWHKTARELCAHLSGDERRQVFGKTAARFYLRR